MNFAALGAVGDLIGDAVSAHGAHSANRAMINFQREAMSTKYQRQVEDLRRAGLNPMLAYMNPATAPPAPHLSNPLASASGAGGRAVNTALMVAQVDKTKAEADLIRAQTPGAGPKLAAETEHSAAAASAQRADVDRIAAQASHLRTEADLNRLQMQVLALDVSKLRAILPSLIEEARGNAARTGFGATTLAGAERYSTEWNQFLEKLWARVGSNWGRSGAVATSAGRAVKDVGRGVKSAVAKAKRPSPYDPDLKGGGW